MGGFSGTKRLSSVETYDIKSDMWEDGTPMPTARSDFLARCVDVLSGPVKVWWLPG